MPKAPWNKIFIETTDSEGQKSRVEMEAPVYPSKTSAAKRHSLETKEAVIPDCFYCRTTNGNLTLEQEKTIIESVNKLVEEKKNAKRTE